MVLPGLQNLHGDKNRMKTIAASAVTGPSGVCVRVAEIAVKPHSRPGIELRERIGHAEISKA
jgi:hypothetical protein